VVEFHAPSNTGVQSFDFQGDVRLPFLLIREYCMFIVKSFEIFKNYKEDKKCHL
jgi:hypothetical protein